MLQDLIQQCVIDELGFSPTLSQQQCIELLSNYLVSPHFDERVFLLKGYAGTGKTSVVSALVRVLQKIEREVVLLAPTGRAAKVLSSYAGLPASSIHRYIYRQRSVVDNSFDLGYNKLKGAVFVVDEASMISNAHDDNAFGSGCLLEDLITFVRQGADCSLIFVGDTAQLQPVGQDYSPALDADYMRQYYDEVISCTLNDVVRQAEESGILFNATQLRQAIDNFDDIQLNTGFPDFVRITGMEFVDTLQQCYNEYGEENCVVITRSNKRAVMYNDGIRAQVLQMEDEISSTDRLMVTKNDYFWSQPYDNLAFIANGDMVEVLRLRKHHEMYGFRFAEASLRLPDYDMELDAMLLIDALRLQTPQEVERQRQLLVARVEEDYLDIRSRRERYQEMRKDKYFNALNCRFAYAVTCHKAQGGQWDCVFIDQAIFSEDMIDPEFTRWLYTAVTRAKSKLYLVNFLDCFFADK